jgi:hypothetical protein
VILSGAAHVAAPTLGVGMADSARARHAAPNLCIL